MRIGGRRHLVSGMRIGCSRHLVSGVRIGCSRRLMLMMRVGILGESRRGDQRWRQEEPSVPHAAPSSARTVTTLNMPACMCSSMWQ
jgi:hypothetical protein